MCTYTYILSLDIIYFFEQIWDILLPLWILSTIIIIWLIFGLASNLPYENISEEKYQLLWYLINKHKDNNSHQYTLKNIRWECDQPAITLHGR